jgi:hypothetical protein
MPHMGTVLGEHVSVSLRRQDVGRRFGTSVSGVYRCRKVHESPATPVIGGQLVLRTRTWGAKRRVEEDRRRVMTWIAEGMAQMKREIRMIYFAKGCRGMSLRGRVTSGFDTCQVDIIDPEQV